MSELPNLWRILEYSLVLPMDWGEQLQGNPLPCHVEKRDKLLVLEVGPETQMFLISRLQTINPKWKTLVEISNKKNSLLLLLYWPVFYKKICALHSCTKKVRFFFMYKKYKHFYCRMKCSIAFVSQWLVLVMSMPPWCTAESTMLESNFAFLKIATS